MRNFFEFFSLPTQFDVDPVALDDAYHTLQRLVHPDRFVSATEAQKRTAVQYASLANDAYQTLRNPLKRAKHLCALHGVRMDANAKMDPEFLMEQMEWRENLASAKETGDKKILGQMAEEQTVRYARQLAELKVCLDDGRFDEAVSDINKLMFLERMGTEVRQALEGFPA